MQEVTLGLRERQRVQVLKELHEAAIGLVLENGMAAATVDAVTERAGVSRRTFFNYYASKEDAVLGATAPSVPADALARYLDTASGEDALTRTLQLIVAILRSTVQPGSSLRARAALVARFPELRDRLGQHVTAAEALVETVLDEHSVSTRGTPLAADSSRALLILAGAVLRFAYTRDPSAVDTTNPEAIDRAIAVFRIALAELS